MIDMHRWRHGIAAILLILVGLVIAIVLVVTFQMRAETVLQKEEAAQQAPLPSPESQAAAAQSHGDPAREIPRELTVIPRGAIAWHAPKEDTTIVFPFRADVFTMEIGDAPGAPLQKVTVQKPQFFAVGDVREGNFAGATVYNLSIVPQDGYPMAGASSTMLLVKDGVFTVLLAGKRVMPDLQNTSDQQPTVQGGIAAARTRWIDAESGLLAPDTSRESVVIDTTTAIEELWLPERIAATVSDRSITLTSADLFYQYGIYPVEDARAQGADLPVLTTPFGDVFSGSAQDFVIALPDGTAALYAYDLTRDLFATRDQIGSFSGVPRIRWADGSVNEHVYKIRPMGCVAERVDVVGADTLITATQIGTDPFGGMVYGPGSVTDPAFQSFYKDVYFVPEGQQRMAEAALLAQRPILYWKDPFGRILRFIRDDFSSPAECGKPVIYLYPEHAQDITVRVVPTGGFTVTDPQPSDDGAWYVHATPKSVITERATGKTYPYLFWEGRGTVVPPAHLGGSVVAIADIPAFLDRALAAQGLSSTEIADFKAFWVPRMQAERATHVLVTFYPQTMINANAPLTITPRPDTVIRVLMDYVPADAHTSYTPQHFKAPARKGFTVVEWGGVLR